jgi:hypothetical protein
MTFQISAILLSWFAIALLALVVAGLVRQVNGLIQRDSVDSRRSHGFGPQVGMDLSFMTREIDFDGTRGETCLLFVSESCASCRKLLAELNQFAPERGFPVRLRVLMPTSLPDSFLPYKETLSVFDRQQHLFEKLRVGVLPYAVFIDDEGTVREATIVQSADQVIDLMVGQEPHPKEVGI